MAHPTVKFFCVEANGEYKMIRCSWLNYPRPSDLEGSHPYYGEPHRLEIRFWDITPENLDLVGRNYDKVTLETWTAPDCIFEKRMYGQWYNFGHRVLWDVTFVKGTFREEDSWKYLEVIYRFEKLTEVIAHEHIQLSVDHIPDDLNVRHKLGWSRPRLTAADIIAHRGFDNIKPDIIIQGE